ncbi:MAG TPA: hypothetical protein VIL86_10460 [Tepidisphaeraceae bacterium]
MESFTADDIVELRHDIQHAIDQHERGESAPWDAEAFKVRARELVESRRVGVLAHRPTGGRVRPPYEAPHTGA